MQNKKYIDLQNTSHKMKLGGEWNIDSSQSGISIVSHPETATVKEI
jgi:hypothetical protein